MAHSHYVMDLCYDDGNPEALRREVLRITAADDDEAIAEASRISSWRHPARYDVRAIAKAARSNHRVVFASELIERPVEKTAEPKAVEDETVAQPDSGA